MLIDPVELSQKLLAFETITPQDNGIMSFISNILSEHHFRILDLSSNFVKNIYAKLNDSKKNLCFAGHTDVVPTGNLEHWKYPPFQPTIDNGILYGRGAVDMKTAIACWISAVYKYLDENSNFDDSISLLITGDEEGIAIDGTKQCVERLMRQNEIITDCIVGEPTNTEEMGQMMKIGRRGSVNYTLTVTGKQGHVAYPEHAANPIPIMNELLQQLSKYQFDYGNDYFIPTNLEITSIDTGNDTTNIIPLETVAKFNIRFNSEHQVDGITNIIDNICEKTILTPFEYSLSCSVSGESFLTKPTMIMELLSNAVEKVHSRKPVLSTTGGTSDARFIQKMCPVIEYGLINKTAHQINESIAVSDIYSLTQTYYYFIKDYFYR